MAQTATLIKNYMLQRTGQSPLKFGGKLLKQVSGERQLGIEHPRYHEISIYETLAGKYVVHIAYISKWEGETNHYTADFFANESDVEEELRRYQPAKYVQGYPPGANFADKQARLVRDLTRRYEVLVSEVLAGERFAETIE